MPPHGGVFVGLWLLLAPCVTGSPPGAGGATLAFVFDTTGSMYDDLVQVTDGASRILERTLSRGTKLIRNYVLVPFHDPEVGPATLTTDPRLFQQRLQQLQVQGGGDCPEMSVAAIRLAAEVSHPGSFIYVFTDARAKDYEQQEELLRLLQHKQSQVVFVLTGDCGDRSHPGYRVYERVAATSSGQVFHLDKQQVKEVLKWVEEAIQASKVHLLSADHEDGGEHTWPVPFDPSLKEVTVSLSGPAPQIEVRDPAGKLLEKGHDLKELLSIPDSAVVVAVQPHEPGMWQVKTQSSGRHSVRITGVSSINFQAGFSTQPDPDGIRPGERPLQGLPISVVVNCSGLEPPGHLQEIELFNSSGHALLSLPLRPLSNASSGQLWVGSPLRAPSGDFLLKVKGEDAQGHPLQRLSSVTYTSVVPGLPQVNISGRIQAYRREPQRISCSAHSELPFRLQLSRAGARLGEEKQFRGSGNSSWLIPVVSKSDEGFYECTATSKVGVTRARAYVSVSEPPPRLLAPGNVTASPGQDVVLSCPVLSAVPYNLTWSWDGRVALQGGGRARLLQNHSLEISRVQPGDAGPYECIARSAHGTATASVWLFVQEAPWVEVDASPQRFSRGQELRLNCTAGGYPQPHITWKLWGWVLEQDQRVFTDSQGTLHIRAAVPEDAGNYSCSANNLLGQDEQAISLEYIEPPAILAVTPSVKALVGEDVTLECWVSGVPPPQIAWHKGEQEVAAFPAGSQRGVLRLQAVREEDAGPYTCQARGKAGDAFASTVLDVGSAPHFPEPLGDLEVEIGESVTLPCHAEGSPPLRVAWYRQDGKPVVHQQGLPGAKLLIHGASLDDQAVYVCEAQNDFGKIRAEVKLTVTGQGLIFCGFVGAWVPVKLKAQPKPMVLGMQSYAWSHPSPAWVQKCPSTSSVRYSLRVQGTSCRARGTWHASASPWGAVSSKHSSMLSLDATFCSYLSVPVPPRIQRGPEVLRALVGERLELPCVAHGDPVPSLSWSKDGRPLQEGEWGALGGPRGAVIIGAVQLSDAGRYRCIASSRVGQDAVEVVVQVLEPPYLEDGAEVLLEKVLHENVTIPCPVKGTPTPSILWWKDAVEVLDAVPGAELLDGGSLFIHALQPSHSGDYTCLAANDVGSVSSTTTLVVHAPLEMMGSGWENVSVVAGQPLALHCNVSGTPVPSVTWHKDGQPVGEAGGPLLLRRGQTLRFAAVRSEDTGTYTCRALSRAGEARRHFALLVLVPPSMPGSQWPHNVSVPEGSEVLLECRSGGVPRPRVRWLKDGQPLPKLDPHLQLLEEEQVLRIPGSQPHHQGTYQCLATNPAGQHSKVFQLHVHTPPSILGAEELAEVVVLLNGSGQLPCEARGSPAPNIAWFRGRRPLPSGTRTTYVRGGRALQVSAAQEADAGLYVCRATNPAGTAHRTVRLEVYVPPTISSEGRVVEAAVGQPVELLCSASGNPLPTLSWQKDGLPLPEGAGVLLLAGGTLLRVQRASESSAGSYTCLASSPAGESAVRHTLLVQAPPQLLIGDGESHMTAVANDSLRIRCRARGVPMPRIRWLKDGRPLGTEDSVVVSEDSGTLLISHVGLAHQGLYVCQGSSRAGAAQVQVWVLVQARPSVSIAEGDAVTVALRQPVTLRCQATGTPPPWLVWRKDGVPLPATSSLFQIEKADLTDEGVYTCVAANPAGEDKQDVMLKVLVPPNIEPSEVDLAVLENSTVSLECLATGVPAPDISWYKGNEQLVTSLGRILSRDRKRLEIPRARLPDAGSYRCVASNAAGDTELGYSLRVTVPPRITAGPSPVVAVTSEAVTLRCNATGSPAPALLWLKDGNPVPEEVAGGPQILSSGRVLSLPTPRLLDSGTYTCVASSAAGEDRREATVEVRLPPTALGEEENVSAIVNQEVTLRCPDPGVDPRGSRWLKDGTLLTPNPGMRLSVDGTVLQVGRAAVQDAGRYTCQVPGHPERHYNLNVLVPPAFSSAEPTTMSVLEGQSVRLACECHGIPFPALSWQKDGEPLSAHPGSPKLVSAGGRMLYIEKVRLVDEGTYTCECSNAAGSSSKEHRLGVHVLPRIRGSSKAPRKVSVIEASETVLECEATGTPAPTVTWLKDGQPVASGDGLLLSEQGWRLRIAQAALVHAGQYVCLAANAAGQERREFDVAVHVPPKFIQGSGYTSNIRVALHRALTLTCEATGVPLPTVTWSWNGSPITPSEHTRVLSGGWMLRLPRVRAQDGGHYSCLASNVAGEVRREFHVEVLVPPRIEDMDEEEAVTVPEGHPVTWSCLAAGNPQPDVTWLKDGHPLPGGATSISPDGSVLRIPQAAPSDAGRYSCVASNPVGEQTKHYLLNVSASPTHAGDAHDATVEDVIVIINNPISLLCEAPAYPPPSITWLKNEVPIEASRDVRLLSGGHGLQILNAQEEDAGTYSCVVAGEAGEAVRNYTVKVLVPPSIARDDPSGEFATTEVRTRVNSTVTLQCETWAVPEPTIQWYKDGQLLESAGHLQILHEGQVLQIKPVSVPDSGHYICVATNPLGADDKDFSVHVQVPPLFQHQLSSSEAFEILYREEDGDGEVTEHRQAVLHQPAALSCDTSAIPPPRLTWYKDGEPLAPGPGVLILLGGRVLQLPAVREEDAGRYTCEASNEAGRDRVHYELEVLAAPAIRGAAEERVEEVTATTNSTVRFECQASGRPVPAVSWLRDDVPIAASPRHQLLEGGTVLQVAVAEVGDAGSYVCVAENPAGSAEKHFALVVLEPPGAEDLQQETLDADMGSPLVLTCAVTGVPAVTWLKDGRQLASSPEQDLVPRGGQLQISALQPSHQGRYTCLAQDRGTEMRKDFLVLVRVAPRILGAGVPSEHSVPEGGGVRLECRAEGQPPPQISWLKDGQPLQLQPPSRARMSPDGSALLLEALHAADSGAYTCLARNGAGEDARLHVLSVLVPPIIEGGADGSDVVRGVLSAAVTLRCRARVSPPLRVSWLKDGLPLRLSPRVTLLSAGHVLRISRTQVSDAGLYTCVVSSQAGVADRSFVLQILAPPVLESPESSEEQVVAKGSDVTFTCEASGSPAPTVTWLKLGKTPVLPSERVANGPQLGLGAVGPADAGVYVCVASNEAGEASRAFSLLVMEPPQIEDASHPTEMSVAVGAPLELTCVVAGVPVPAVTWEKDGQLLAGPWLSAGNESTLRISSMEVADSGLYTCLAASPAGEDSRSFHVSARGSVAPARGGCMGVQTSGSLLITSPSPRDEGWFECVATNAAGEARKVFLVSVHVPPTIADDLTDVAVTRLSHAVLTCYASGVPPPTVSWSKDGAQLGRRGGGYRVLPTGALEIRQALPAHTGHYTCTARNTAGTARKHLRLVVHEPPALKPLPGMVMVLVNTSAVLSCEASGVPRPEVTWQKDGASITRGPGLKVLPSGQLHLLRASVADAGSYLCVARNPSGTAMGRTRLIVQVHPHTLPNILGSPMDGVMGKEAWFGFDFSFSELRCSFSPFPVGTATVAPHIQMGPEELNVPVNGSATLPCQAAGWPVPRVTWRKDGQLLSLRGSSRLQLLPDGSLQIDPVRVQDSGYYLCVASSPAGSDRRGLDLRVLVPPAIAPGPPSLTLLAQQPASLACDVSGSPAPRVRWEKDGRPLNPHLLPGAYRVQTSGSLLITSPSPRDEGWFGCIATNAAGEARKVFLVSVHVPPTIADDLTDVAVTRLSPAVLTCYASGVPPPTVSWSKDGAQLGRRGGGYRVLPTGALEIKQALPAHTGHYTCTARNTAGTARKHLRLVVHEPPALKPLPGMVLVLVNTSAVLSCEASGVPRPEVTWQKDGASITRGPGLKVLPSGQLHLLRASVADAGSYLCMARNPSGTAMGRTRLIVQVPPTIVASPVELAVLEGQDALLPCAARGIPEPRVSWSREGAPVQDRGGTVTILPSGELLLRHVQEGDAGSYSCAAVNSAGKAIHRLSLRVHTLPTFTRRPGDVVLSRGEQLELVCEATGSPEPHISWMADGQPLTEGISGQRGRSTLRRATATHADSGTYVCRAENSAGTIRATSLVSVTEAPIVQGAPSTYRVEPPGGDAVLDCDARGHPAPFIRWSKDGVPVVGSRRLRQLQNGSLAIRSLGSADAGHYRCVAENEVGTAAKVVTLALQSAPVVVVTPRAQSVRAGQRVLLHCTVSGEPTPSVEWQRDGEALPEGPRGRILPNATLLLPAAIPRDTGTYTCIARNALGSAAARTSLVVQGEPRRVRGSLIGVINTREFGVATLNASVLDEPRSGTTAIRTSISGVPQHVGPLMRVLVTLMAPVYWSFTHAGGDVPSGILLTQGVFRHKSQVEFGTGDLLHITHLARGADASGTLLLDSVVSGSVPESIGEATLLLQDFSERYVQTGAGRFSGGSVQSFLQDGSLARARCNHTVEYEPTPGPQLQRVQRIQAREVQASFDPASEELSFQLSTSLDAGDQCPPGFVLDPQQLHCLDINECAEGSHACRYNQICENTMGTHRCVCPRGYRSLGAAWPCLDINECLQFPPPCAFECRNLRGSYECLCPPGTALLPEGECGAAGAGGGTASSTPWDPLLRWLGPSSRLRGRSYPRLTLSRVAKAAGPDARGPCPSGFVRRNGTCTDLDECRVPNQCQHECRNSEGSYRCVCPPGYRLLPDGKTCHDVDECTEGTVRCASAQLCFNTRGGARCEDAPCPDGYWRGSSPGVCFSHCAPDCGTAGPATLRYVLLPLPLGVPAGRDVLRLAPGSALGARTLFTLLEQDGSSPFALRAERGQGVVATMRPLHAPSTHRLRVQALTPGARQARSIFLIIISISPYPY
nr:hemicentin-2 [Anser cygnoides]